MKKYHKIQTVFKRDPETKFKTLLEGQFSLPEFEYLAENEWIYTEKVDGTNTRIMFDGEKITFGGKSDNSQIPSKLLNNLNELFLPRLELFKSFFGIECNVCLYGEGYGKGIQAAGKNYSEEQKFVLFDVNIGGWWLKSDDVEDIARKLLIDIVPVIGSGTLYKMIEDVRSGIVSDWGDFKAEGIVARPKVELKTRDGHRIITKLKCRDFR